MENKDQHTNSDKKSKSVLKNLIYKIFKYLNFVFSGALVLSYISVHVNPENFWFLAFFGLAYPVFLFINILYLLFWLIRLNKLFLISLISILIGWNHLDSFIQIPLKNSKVEKISNSINVLSYNVRVFNLYNWNNDTKSSDKIFNFINKNTVDVICFQEFLTNTTTLTEREIKNKLNNKFYSHIAYSNSNRKYNYGIATYSKYPIINRGLIKFNNTSNISIYTDIVIGIDTIRVFNNHLQSIRFNKKNYSFIASNKSSDEEETIKELRDISTRLKDAFIKRSQQAEILAVHIKNSPYPVFVCGDFNDTPVSYTYQKISKNLNDSFKESGKGIGNTYLGKFPSYRIDYILFSSHFTCNQFSIPEIVLSDHYPVLASFSILNK